MNIFAPGFPGVPSGVDKLAKLFRNTDTSYKYLWFLAILEEFSPGKYKETDGDKTIRFAKLAKFMLERAHLYTHHFELKLGHKDHLNRHLNNVLHECNQSLDKPNTHLDENSHREFWNKINIDDSSPTLQEMYKYVPKRLLSPFLKEKVPEAKKNRVLDNTFGRGYDKDMDDLPLYFYCNTQKEIYVPTIWGSYFNKHNTILKKWVLRELSCYLERRNSGVPCIGLKLEKLKRGTLNKQHDFWKLVQSKKKLICPYSGSVLTDKYVVDHFIPYSFIYHDELWNLVPATQEANLKKSDRLPPLDKYLDRFLSTQKSAIEVLVELVEPEQKFADYVQVYKYEIFEEDLDVIVKHPEDMLAKLGKIITYNHQKAAELGYPIWEPTELSRSG